MNVVLTREQVRQVDQIAIDEYGISGLVLMENAGRNAARIILAEITARNAGESADSVNRVLIFCGTGNNGGDGFVIGRHLANVGVDVSIALTGEVDRLSPDATANHRICRAMEIPIEDTHSAEIRPGDLVVDALLGTGFAGQVREPLARVIKAINEAPKACVVAIDVPSGLDCNSGAASNACVIADLTITFVADKTGFHSDEARRYVGQVHVADIGAPPTIVERILRS